MPGSAARSSRARAGGRIGTETLRGCALTSHRFGRSSCPRPGRRAVGHSATPRLRGRGVGGASLTTGHWSEYLTPPPRGGARGPRRPAQTAPGGWRAHTQCLPLNSDSQRPRAALVGVQGPHSPVVTYLKGSSPAAGSEVSAAAKRVCSARNRPRALPPLPGPLAGAPPGGRTLLPPHLFPSLFLPLLPSFLHSQRRLHGLLVSGISCSLNTYLPTAIQATAAVCCVVCLLCAIVMLSLLHI